MRILTVAILFALASCSGKESEQPPPKAQERKAESKDANDEPNIPSVPLPEDPSAALPLNKATKKLVLDNGLTVFVRKNSKPEKRAQFWLAVNVGSYHEDDDQLGLAHFMEHMAFNGTKKFPKNELVSKLQKLGAKFGPHINAYTSFDETVYKLEVPTDDPEAIDTALTILREWASEITLNKDDVVAERGVVIAEKRNTEGFQERLSKKLINKIFAGGRYAKRLPIGDKKILSKASPKLLRRFYEDWYQPHNMAVIAVGDFDAADIEARLEKSFSSLAKPDKPRSQPERVIPERHSREVFELRDKEMPMSAVAFGRLIPSRQTRSMKDFHRSFKEMVAMTMLAKRLDEAKKRGDARYIGAAGSPAPLVRAGDLIGFFAVVSPGEAKGGFEDLLDEVERARRHGFTKGEYRRAVENILSSMESTAAEEAAGKESSAALVDELKRYFLTGESAPGRHMELSLVRHFAKTTKLEDLQAFVDDFLQAPDLVVASIGPPNAKFASEAELLTMFEAVKSKNLTAYSDEKSKEPLIAKPPAPGTIKSKKHHKESEVHEWTLSNGARVLLKPTDFKKDEVVFQALSHGGTSEVPLETMRAARWAAAVVPAGGLAELDAISVERRMAGHQASVTPTLSRYTEGLQGSAASADVEQMLQLAYLLFTAPRSDEKAFAVWKEAQQNAIELGSNDPSTRFRRKRNDFLGEGDPRYLPAESIEAIERADLSASMALFRERFQDADDFTFIIVGSFDLKAIEPLVLRYLGSLPSTDRKDEVALVRFPVSAKKRRLVVRDATTKRADFLLRYATEIDSAKYAKDYKARAAFKLFGDALSLRLLELLREKMGETYSVQAIPDFENRFTRAELRVVFSVASSRASQLESIAQKQVALAAKDGVSAERFGKVKEGALKNLEVAMESNGAWANALTFAVNFDAPFDYLAQMKAAVESVTLEDANAAGKALVNPKTPAIAVHLPK